LSVIIIIIINYTLIIVIVLMIRMDFAFKRWVFTFVKTIDNNL